MTQVLSMAHARLSSWLLALLLLGSSLTVLAAPGRAIAAEPTNIVDTAVAAGDFKTLVTALQATGLDATLKGPGPFTVFAPTDEAFAKLPAGTLDSLLANPDQLKAILTYHVVPGAIMVNDILKLGDAKTVNGELVTFVANPQGLFVNNATVIVRDITTTNGVIHAIDTVLLPPAPKS